MKDMRQEEIRNLAFEVSNSELGLFMEQDPIEFENVQGTGRGRRRTSRERGTRGRRRTGRRGERSERRTGRRGRREERGRRGRREERGRRG